MRALIVDDDAASLSLVEHLVLRVGGVTPIRFSDPVACAEALDFLEFDVALLDYHMPEMDGVALLRRIRAIERHRSVPIVMITTAEERAVRIEAVTAGANDFLTKPLDPVEFKARLVNMLTLRRAQRDLSDHNVRLAEEVKRATTAIAAREEEIILRLARATEYRDGDTGDHLFRMARLCRLIAEALGFEAETCRTVYLASFMHDIGKVAIPDEILFKPAQLSVEERRVMEGHARVGEAILAGSDSPLVRAACEIAGGHHEHWDGGGYPRGLKGEEIPIMARIAAVADVFDALTSARPYKRAWTPAEARAYLVENVGIHFDPACVEALLSRWSDALSIIGLKTAPNSLLFVA